MAEENEQQVSLKLIVEEEKNRVVSLECDNDFIDILFSFMTMPIGTIIRLAGKQSKLGSLTNLYQSVEDLDQKFLQTQQCKTMLLHPYIALEEQLHKKLVVKIKDAEPPQHYICSMRDGPNGFTDYVSVLKGTPCPLCWEEMNKKITRTMPSEAQNGNDGVFVEGRLTYMVSCDLKICPLSSSAAVQLLEEFGIRDGTTLEERDVNVGAEEVFNLLKCMLLSKTPLTDAFLGFQDKGKFVDNDSKHIASSATDRVNSFPESLVWGLSSASYVFNLLKCMLLSKTPSTDAFLGFQDKGKFVDNDSKHIASCPTERDIDTKCKKMSMKLLVRKSSNKVLYAEASAEFTEFLFSFLTFPLGTISKCLGGSTSMGCVDNMYKSIKDFSMLLGMKSDCLKGLLIGPKLPPYFGSKNQLLQIEEQRPWENYSNCMPYYGTNLWGLNPKYHGIVKDLGGAFLKGPAAFMITDELVVKPLTFMSIISCLYRFHIPMSEIEEQVVSVGEEEAISLLKASLVSSTVLSDVFSSSN